MVMRCHNPNAFAFKWYGARGIRVCDRWRNFENFFADMGLPPAGGTLERINNDGPYSKKNCIWASRKIQSNNSRHNHLLKFNGHTRTIGEWSQITKIQRLTIYMRLKRGWSVERALTIPVK